jgi:hypothetical protein
MGVDIRSYGHEALNILSGAAVHAYTDIPSDAECERINGPLVDLTVKILRKNFSDSPTVRDQQKCFIEVLETAIKLAKGEIKL